MPKSPSAKEHEKSMKENLPKFWSEHTDRNDPYAGMYSSVELNRYPYLRAIRGGFGKAYGQLLPPGGKILVQGAGKGFERLILPENIPNSRIVFSDLSEDAIKELKKRFPDATAHVGSSFDLPYKPGTFSAITSMDHLDVFNKEHLPEVVEQNFKMLKPGGMMIVTQSSVPSLHWADDREAYERQIKDKGSLTDAQLDDIHDNYAHAVIDSMKKGGFKGVKKERVAGIYVGPIERRHLPRLPKIRAPGMMPAMVADRGQASPQMLDSNAMKHIGLPPLREIMMRHRDPIAEIFLSYVIYGKKPET